MTVLSRQTPPEIDAQLAALHRELESRKFRVSSCVESLYRVLGERPLYRGKTRYWSTPSFIAEESVRALAEGGAKTDREERAARQVLTELENVREAVTETVAALRPFNDEFDARGGWSRFFLVQGGHLHARMSCSTCYPTTQFALRPELSGSTEADAVDAYGPLLCSVCFPTAPVEWTLGKPKPPRCNGAGKPPEKGTRTKHGMRSFGACSELGCDYEGQLTPSGAVRAHKPPNA